MTAREQKWVFRGLSGTLTVTESKWPVVEWHGPGDDHINYLSCDRMTDGSLVWYGPGIRDMAMVDMPPEFVGLAFLLMPDFEE